MNNLSWILLAICFIELLVILIIAYRKQKKGRNEAAALSIRIINGDDVDAKEADALLRKSDDFVIPYILKAMIYRKQGKPERSFNTLISLLVKSSLKRELKRTINFMAAEDLHALGRYDEAMKYADKADSLFFRKNYVNLLRAKIRLFQKGEIEQELIKTIDKPQMIRMIKNAYQKEYNRVLLKNAIAYSVFDADIAESYIRTCTGKSVKDGEVLMSADYSDMKFTRQLMDILFKWIGLYENPDRLAKKILSSSLPHDIRDMLTMYIMHAGGAEEQDMRIHLESMRRNIAKVQYPELMIYTLMKTGHEKFIPLFREAE